MNEIILTNDDPTINVTLTLGTIVGERLIDPGTHEEPPAYEPVSLLDAIIERAASQLVEHLTKDDRYNTLRKRTLEVRDELIRERLHPMVAAAVDEPFQRTNDYGMPKGPPQTIRSIVTEAVHQEATKALRITKSTYASDRSVLENLVATTVPAVLTKELSAEIAAAKGLLRESVKASAAEILATALTPR